MDEQNYIKQLEYLDTRSVWPVLVIGMRCYSLEGKKAGITVEEAKQALGLV